MRASSRRCDASDAGQKPPSAGHPRAFRLGVSASVLESIGAAATWAGLPVYVAHLTGDMRALTWLFTAEMIAGIATSLIAGTITDRFSARTVILTSALITSAALLSTYLTLTPGRTWPFFALGLTVTASGIVASNALRVWFVSLAPEGQIAEWIGRRGVWLTCAKLAGTGSGPFLFQIAGSHALFIDAFTVLAAGLVYAMAARYAPSAARQETQECPLDQLRAGWQLVARSPKLFRLIALQVSAGLLGMPLTALCVRLLGSMHKTGNIHYSAFWAIGFCAGIIANALIGKGLFCRFPPRMVIGTSFVATAGVLGVLVHLHAPVMFLGGYLFVAISRTVLNVMLFSAVIPAIPSEFRGRVIAISDMFSDGTSLLAVLGFGIIHGTALLPVVTLYLLIIACAGCVIMRRLGMEIVPPS